MSEFENRTKAEVWQLRYVWIKLRVKVALTFFKKTQIEREIKEFNNTMEKELKSWAKENGMKFNTEIVEKPITIRGHTYYQMDAKKKYIIISFSK